MKSGYDQFFKKVRQTAAPGKAPSPLRSKPSFDLPQKPESSSKPTAMAQKLRNKLSEPPKKKMRKGISWKLVGLSLTGLLIGLFGLQYHDKAEGFLKNIEISLGTAMAEEKPAPIDKKQTKAAPAVDAKDAKPEEVKPEVAKKDFSQEDINHFMKLNERKRELDAREEELNRAEVEIAAQKAELEKRLGELESTRKQISSVLEEKVQADDKKVDNLVQMYSNMKPQQAAKVFENMDEDLAVEILARMKRKPAAEIMNLVKAEKAQVFSEKYTGYKRK